MASDLGTRSYFIALHTGPHVDRRAIAEAKRTADRHNFWASDQLVKDNQGFKAGGTIFMIEVLYSNRTAKRSGDWV